MSARIELMNSWGKKSLADDADV